MTYSERVDSLAEKLNWNLLDLMGCHLTSSPEDENEEIRFACDSLQSFTALRSLIEGNGISTIFAAEVIPHRDTQISPTLIRGYLEDDDDQVLHLVIRLYKAL